MAESKYKLYKIYYDKLPRIYPQYPIHSADTFKEAYDWVLNRYEDNRDLKKYWIRDDINENIIRIEAIGYQYQ